jgi:hypothetical protein
MSDPIIVMMLVGGAIGVYGFLRFGSGDIDGN